MLLGEGNNDDWKLINYRQVGDLIVAEFLHDLYNQAMVDLNPVHFRNTVCVVENGELRSFAPQKEWDCLADALGQNLVRDPALRDKFSKYLERSQKDLTDLMDALQKKYTDPTAQISALDTFYDLSNLQYMALDRIYAINLVQFEHALGHALTNILSVPKEEVDKLLKSSELTISGQEEMRAINLSLQVSRQKMPLEKAIELHNKEFGGINLAYGAERENFHAHSQARLEALLQLSEEQRQLRLQALQTATAPKSGIEGKDVVQELADLAKKLGERRDRNKALMGKVSGVRANIMNKIAEIGGVDRAELRHYFMKDIFHLLTKKGKLSSQEIEKRKGRIVLQRQEREVYGIEAVSLSEAVFPTKKQATTSSEIIGIVASSGTIRGKVRRVYTIEEARKVQKDEILVAYGTDFDLMIGLQNCAGVITEEGGLLSHASVISRELGKPCLINAKNAMNMLCDGDVVEINTDKASVQVVRRSRSSATAVSLLENMAIDDIRGAKAKNLYLMGKAGLPTLPAILVSVESPANSGEIASSVLSTFSQKGIITNSFIVRSNTENEDTAGQSMAGQYKSVVSRSEQKNLSDIILEVLASYKDTKVQQLNVGKDPGNTVLIQPYYAQQYGGVAFSHHPVTKKTGVVIEASNLGAAAVVEGQKTSENVPQHIKQEVTEAVLKIEQILNCPVDVEWGYGSDGLKIFQARPIIFKNANPKPVQQSKKLIVIAGGEGSRIKEMFNKKASPFTKHFLPLPEKGGSVLGAIIEKSKPYFDVIEISASKNTIDFTSSVFGNEEKVSIANDNAMIGPLGPPLMELLASGKRVFACCGDVYSNLDWTEMEKSHDHAGNPVTILVAKSFPAEKAACFSINEDGKIVGWDRKEKSTSDDYINIGGYIIDPTPEVVKIAKDLIAEGKCKEDVFFEHCLEAGILSGYRDDGFSCNINTPEIYQDLVKKIVDENSAAAPCKTANNLKPPGQ